jgi:FkbM family methyltransferase
VLSAGVGQAITFERTISDHTGCSIVLLDPSPTGIATMAQSAWQHPRIDFRPIGLAGQDGTLGFDPPDRADEGSWKTGVGGCQTFFVCRSISSLMQENRWPHIDLLKMDIEGFEYAVIDDILAHRLEVRQICVEFHCDKQITVNYTRSQMLWYVLRLIMAGYRLVYWTNSEFTFVRER